MKVYELVSKVMSDIGAISKDRKNQQQGYQFRGIDDMYNAIYPCFVKHGLFTVPTVLDVTREERPSKSGGMLIYTTVKVNYKLYASDGSFLEAVCIGEGMDSGDKSANKAMAAAHKYFFMQTFCIPTEEIKDSEVDSPEVAPAKPDPKVMEFEQAMTKCKNLDELAAFWNSNSKLFYSFTTDQRKALTATKDNMKAFFSK